MYYLLIGFITPAVVFAILGFIACWRRNSSVDFKEYESIASTEIERGFFKGAFYHTDRSPPPSFSMTFQNKHFISSDLPPSYSEATSFQKSEYASRHIPRESAQKHATTKLRPQIPPAQHC